MSPGLPRPSMPPQAADGGVEAAGASNVAGGGAQAERGAIVAGDAYRVERVQLLRAFGEKLRAARERENLSQETFAEIANIHRTQLSALERGKRDPSLTMLLILAHALRLRPGALLEGLFVPGERKSPTHAKRGRAQRGKAGR